jgi:hypothetical protein
VSRDRPGNAEALLRTRDAAMRSGAGGGAGAAADGTRGRREFGDFMRRLHEEVTSKSRTVLLIMTINPDRSLAGSSTSELRPTIGAKA